MRWKWAELGRLTVVSSLPSSLLPFPSLTLWSDISSLDPLTCGYCSGSYLRWHCAGAEDLILDLLFLMGGQEAPTQCVTCEAGGAPRTEEEESVSEVTVSCPPSLKWVNDCSRWGESRPNRNTASTLPRYLTFILFLTVLVIYLFQTFWDNSTLLVLFLWTYLSLYLYTVSLPGSDRFFHRPRPHPCSPAQVPLLGFKWKDLFIFYLFPICCFNITGFFYILFRRQKYVIKIGGCEVNLRINLTTEDKQMWAKIVI